MIDFIMQKNIPYIAILIILFYTLYNAFFRNTDEVKTPINTKYNEHVKTHTTATHYEDELLLIDNDAYTKAYIVKVINHGSNILNFKGGEMEGGFASEEDTQKIACYVMEFSGKKCTSPYPKNAAMFYTSICGGCHGDEGKGIDGIYPDLTIDKMLGIQKREEFLKSMINHK